MSILLSGCADRRAVSADSAADQNTGEGPVNVRDVAVDLPPSPCSPGSVTALPDPCTGEVCTFILRFDYFTLAPKAFAVRDDRLAPVDDSAASLVAQGFLDDRVFPDGWACPDCVVQPSLSASASGVALFEAHVGDFGGFAMVGRATGQVIAAGDLPWIAGGSPAWWQPTAWQSGLACGALSVAAGAQPYAHPAYCPGYLEVTPPYSTVDAAAIAVRTNAAPALASKGPFEVFSYLYQATSTPDYRCRPEGPEFVVVLSQVRR